MSAPEVRGWVNRLGAYLRIFGGRGDAGQPEHRAFVDRLTSLAQEREAEFGRDAHSQTRSGE